MDLSFLNDFFVPVIAGICCCVGYILKNFTGFNNQYIPPINAALGAALAVWINWPAVTPSVLLGGIFSGLAATGLYEAFRNMIGGK